jgi:hypothetical protein
MGWPSRRKDSLSDFQPGHDRKYSAGHFVFDVRGDLVVTNGIGFVEAYGHACLAELQEPLLHRLSSPDWAATRWGFGSVWSYEYELGGYVADATCIWRAAMKYEHCRDRRAKTYRVGSTQFRWCFGRVPCLAKLPFVRSKNYLCAKVSSTAHAFSIRHRFASRIDPSALCRERQKRGKQCQTPFHKRDSNST